MASKEYHHGNLRQALLDAATEEIAEVGLSSMSLRKVAARVGVTHPAANHHFGDKTGLLTALAALGFRTLAATLQDARDAGGGLLELGLSYVRFAHDHRPLFEVMFRPELLDRSDAELIAAMEQSSALLAAASGKKGTAKQQRVARGAWSFVHGFATLWMSGNLGIDSLDDAETEFRRAAVAFTNQHL